MSNRISDTARTERESGKMEPTKCKASITPKDRWGAFHQRGCARLAIRDGFCAQHHPEARKARDEAAAARWAARFANPAPTPAAPKIVAHKVSGEPEAAILHDHEHAYKRAECAAAIVKAAKRWRFYIGTEFEGTAAYHIDAERLVAAVDTLEALADD